MKAVALIFIMLLSSSFLFSQEISDARNENGRIVVYDSQGEKISSMSDAFDNRVVAVAGSFFVTDDGSMIRTFDAKCSRLGSMFSSGKKVISAAGSTFTVDDNGRIVTYDSKCSRIIFYSGDSKEIAYVRIENSSIVVYNAEGDRISSMSCYDRKIVGTTGTFFVVQDDSRIETYDAQCNRIGSMFASGKIVTGAAGSTFTVEENGSRIVTYDSECSRISSRSK